MLSISQLLATDIKIAMKIGKLCILTLEINMGVAIPVSITILEQIRRMRYFRHLRNYFKIKKNASVFGETISHVTGVPRDSDVKCQAKCLDLAK